MKSKLFTLCLSFSALLCAAGAVNAGSMGMVPMPPPPPQPQFCFDQNLRSFDVYAGYRWGAEDNDLLENGDGATAGIGVNLFFNRYIGAGIEGAWVDDEFSDFQTSANLILRLPIDSICLAPYVLGGGGFYFGGEELNTFWQVGAGLEYKMNEFASVFGDYRYISTELDEEFTMARGGLRFSF